MGRGVLGEGEVQIGYPKDLQIGGGIRWAGNYGGNLDRKEY